MDFIIEKARPLDRDAIIKVLTPWNMHRIPSPEAEEIDFSCFFVAKIDNKIIGVSGYTIISKTEAKTRLLAVYPELQGSDVGKALQNIRLEAMYKLGIKKVFSHSSRPGTILWYKKHYGYREVGKRKKLSPHGSDDPYQTILELDLQNYMNNKKEIEETKSSYIASNEAHPLSPYPPLIINVALTGMVPTKISTPYVPINVDEIVEDAIRVCDAGASIVHLHARDKDGVPVTDAKYYEKISISTSYSFKCIVRRNGSESNA